jgi:hypothetical protein
MIFATSVQYMLDRASSGSVVNPIWLFTTTCTVPPVVYPSSWLKFRISATIPCPITAASPCITSGITRERSRSPRRRCFARQRPSTTAATASRWLGLLAIARWSIRPSAYRRVPEYPLWYFTSPPLSSKSSSQLSSNSVKICS